MLRKIWFTVVVCVLLEPLLFAATVRLAGDAPGYEGKKLAVILPLDEFSGLRQVLASTDVRDDGSFLGGF